EERIPYKGQGRTQVLSLDNKPENGLFGGSGCAKTGILKRNDVFIAAQIANYFISNYILHDVGNAAQRVVFKKASGLNVEGKFGIAHLGNGHSHKIQAVAQF